MLKKNFVFLQWFWKIQTDIVRIVELFSNTILFNTKTVWIMEVALILGAILEIAILICFFVLCSNVSKIKKHLIQDDFDAKFKFLMLIGEKEKAREILINRILSNSSIFINETNQSDEGKAKECFNAYGEKLQALGIKNPFLKDEEKKD